MTKILFILAISSIVSLFHEPEMVQKNLHQKTSALAQSMIALKEAALAELNSPQNQLAQTKKMLRREAPNLKPEIIDSTIAILDQAQKRQVNHNHILTIIDYSLNASQKRLWIFDLNQQKLLFHTYVSHGIKSGALVTHHFSNRFNSKCSSIGVYTTEKIYYGRDGLSLRLKGWEPGFNDNASNRSIVMHGSWYVQEPFIKKYGRAGRSWGCPAIPLDLTKPIIHTIKDNSLLVAYYPSEDWFRKSRFLKPLAQKITPSQQASSVDTNDQRDEVLMMPVEKKFRGEESEAILIMQAQQYAELFHTAPPLNRMLRRQIDDQEYIAISNAELHHVITLPEYQSYIKKMRFAVPVMQNIRTMMKIIPIGEMSEIKPMGNTFSSNTYTAYFAHHGAMKLHSTDRFIRWLGL